ncbi:MAG TPA: pentapeptide repeat-containing protein, partial [Capillimicrobium sp.]
VDDCRADLSAMRHATLERVTFRDCDLGEADFGESRLRHVRFERCSLRDADLRLARLEFCELRGCELEGVRGADALRGVAMPWPDIVASAGTLASALGIVVLDGDGAS